MIGELVRTECPQLVVAYTFDLRTNVLLPELVPNPNAGRRHSFRAWRLEGEPANRRVEMNAVQCAPAVIEEEPNER